MADEELVWIVLIPSCNFLCFFVRLPYELWEIIPKLWFYCFTIGFDLLSSFCLVISDIVWCYFSLWGLDWLDDWERKLDERAVPPLCPAYFFGLYYMTSMPTTATPLIWLFFLLTLALLQCLPPVVDYDVFRRFRVPSWLTIPAPLLRLSDSSPDVESWTDLTPKASSIVYIGMNTVLPVSASGPFLPNSGTVLSLYYGGICSRADITLWRPVGGRRAWPLNPFLSIFIYCFKSYWSKSLSLWIKLSWLLLMWSDMFTLARSKLGIAVSWASCRYVLLLSSST